MRIGRVLFLGLSCMLVSMAITPTNQTKVNASSQNNIYYDFAGDNAEIINNNVKGKSGEELLNGLSLLMSSTQDKITTYNELKTNIALTDADPMNDENIITLYARNSISSDWANATVWNREHVWCQSLANGLYGDLNKNIGAGTDIHHLRPALNTYNSTRGNTPYGVIEDKSTAKRLGDTDNFYTSTIFEPSNEIKGDIARVLMYVYTRYSNTLSSSENELGTRGDLKISNVVYTRENTDTAAWNLLLSWNELDPVNHLEMERNNNAQDIEGNRNVFIDHPEFAKMCFGDYNGKGALIDLKGEYDFNKANYIGVNKKSASLSLGATEQIEAKTFPITNIIDWKSSDDDVAIVNSKGLVLALKAGETIITARANDSLTISSKITVKNEEAVFTYDGQALNTSTRYSENFSSTITSNGIEMPITASFGAAQSGALWLGSNSTKANIDKSKISKDSKIGKAIELITDKPGAVLYFNKALSNVSSIAYSQTAGQSYTFLYVLSSIDNGETYSLVTKRSYVDPSVNKVNVNFDVVKNAMFAIALISENPSDNAYVQAKKPTVTFYASSKSDAEIVTNLINILDENDYDNIYFQSIVLNKIETLLAKLDSKDLVAVTNKSKIDNISEPSKEVLRFIFACYDDLYNENVNDQKRHKVTSEYNKLSSNAKELLKDIKFDEGISLNDKVENDFLIRGNNNGNNNNNDNSGNTQQNDNVILFVVMGVCLFALTLVIILMIKKRHKK